ncbi:MAG: phosphate/phosphite/phosphonate ABC transporter substrate-binding protein [Thermodesulfovibrionales bacterium]
MEEDNFLLIGLVPEHRVFAQFDRYTPVADYLAGEIRRKINLIVIPDYGSFTDDFLTTGMDAAFLGSYSYAILHAQSGVEPLARPEGPDGLSTYHGVIFTRKDSGIRTAADMKAKRFVFVDKVSAAGYLLPLVYFKKNGIEDYRSYFKEWYVAGTHDDAIYDVLDGKADIGAAKSTVLATLAKTDPRVLSELEVLEVSPEFPENALCIRRELDASLKAALKMALLTMHQDPRGREVLNKFGAGRFIETSDTDYQPLYQYIRRAGIDLVDFRHMDE